MKNRFYLYLFVSCFIHVALFLAITTITVPHVVNTKSITVELIQDGNVSPKYTKIAATKIQRDVSMTHATFKQYNAPKQPQNDMTSLEKPIVSPPAQHSDTASSLVQSPLSESFKYPSNQQQPVIPSNSKVSEPQISVSSNPSQDAIHIPEKNKPVRIIPKSQQASSKHKAKATHSSSTHNHNKQDKLTKKDTMDSLLKDLEKQSIKPDEKLMKELGENLNTARSDVKLMDELNKNDEKQSLKDGRENTMDDSGAANIEGDAGLSGDEAIYIRHKIESMWHVPFQNYNNVEIVLRVKLSINGNVEDVSVVNVNCASASGPVCHAIEDSAIRAVWLASPFDKLRSDNFEKWREIILPFHPE